jgi:hypothetical protein
MASSVRHSPILDPRTFCRFILFVALGAVVSIAAILATQRFLYADSSHLLLGMWQRGTFYIAHGDRWFGAGAAQWLPALAMQLGWRDAGAVATLFGLNLWLNPALAVLAAWWASKRSQEITLLMLFAVLFLFQTLYLMIEGESSVTFWLVAFFAILTVPRDYSYGALSLLVPIFYTHVSAVLALAPLLAVLLVWRRRYLEYYGPERYRALVAALAVAVALLALGGVGTELGDDRAYFLGGALQTPTNPTFVLTALAFGSLFLQMFRPHDKWLPRMFWASSVSLLILAFALPTMLWPFFHYRSRVLNAALAVPFFLYLHGRVHGSLPPPRALNVRGAVALVSVVFVFQAKMTWEWREHMNLFRSELASVRGIVEFPRNGPFVEPRSRQFSWSWTTPVRSVVFQAMDDREVRAIMLNADTTRWQPFHPRLPAELPDLSAFGVHYAPELLPSDPSERP